MLRCHACHEPVSIDGLDPASKELRCAACGQVVVVVRRPSLSGTVPIPSNLRISERDGFTVERRRAWVLYATILRIRDGVLTTPDGVTVAIDDVQQLYVVPGGDGFELRLKYRGGADVRLTAFDTVWEALAVEHAVEEHLDIDDEPVSARDRA